MKLDSVTALEDRALLAPVLSIAPRLAAFTASTGLPVGTNSGGIVVTLGQADPGFLTDAPFTSVTQLTPASSFGGDIVRIRSGPGGVFGNGLYAISRGAGENGLPAGSTANETTLPPTVTSAVNRPGVIYRVDPATGKTSVFFDLNTVVSQLDPSTTAANSVGAATGLVNWYDITFDPEGYYDGKPSMFVSSVDRADPTKNAVYRIAPDGTFMGAFVQFTDGANSLKFNVNPSAILVPPVEDQTFLKGLIAGGGVSSTGGSFAALYFNANAFTPKQIISTPSLPTGVSQTGLTLGPITGLTAANSDYASQVYSTFTDFGTPEAGGIPATQGVSGVQGINGELLINLGLFPTGDIIDAPSSTNTNSTDSTIGDKYPYLPTDFRRFEDIAFDQYGYFTQGANLGTTTTTTGTGSVGGTGAGGGSGTGLGQNLGAGVGGIIVVNNTVTRPAISLPPANAGNLFVADLATGLSVSVPVLPAATPPQYVRIPVQGPEDVSVVSAAGQVTTTITSLGVGLGGRIVRITPAGVVRNFAENFHTSNNLDSSGFELSSLSITFSADGTTLYAADDDGVWQFKTVASLAGSTSGSLVGLNDLRSLGVPYSGQDSAIAILDTGVDAGVSSFRGRVSTGFNVFTNGFGNDDTAAGSVSTTGTGGTGGGGTGTGGGGTGGTTGGNPALTSPDGHGTLIAGVVAQFVPQATIVPVNVFAPFLTVSTTTTGNTGTGGGGTANTITGNSNALTTSQYLYQGLNYVSTHPFVNDPVRPGQVNRVIATTLGFGTTETFDSEGVAYRRYPQIVIAFKNQLKKFRNLGIVPIGAAGQFGAPFAAGVGAGTTNGGGTTGGTTSTTSNGSANNNAANTNVGDVNGIALPAILNEVISVTGSYPFPFLTGPASPPTTPGATDTTGRVGGPVLLFGNTFTIGGGTTTTGTTTTGSLLTLLTNADDAQYVDRLLGSDNRNITTDYVAPELDIPTFRRRFTQASTTATGASNNSNNLGDPLNHQTFQQGGTSLSAGIVTGSYALVSSALGYFNQINTTGVTSDAYLTGPVGKNVLDFGAHGLKDLTAYNNPDGINSILQWTAVPVTDSSDGLSISTPKTLINSPTFRSYSRISVSNAIAAIEGEVALQYLIAHDDLKYIDANSNGNITAQELQNFVDNSSKMGLPEAGAMARLLGGTARPDPNADSLNPYGQLSTTTIYGETPDQPDVLQRRFNFFDYAAHGTLQGSVTIPELTALAHTLLPSPDSFVINDRQRSSVDGYLLAPTAERNYHDLVHISPRYQFIPKAALVKFRNISPAQFKVGKGVSPSTGQFPLFTLFASANKSATIVSNAKAPTTTTGTTGTTAPKTTVEPVSAATSTKTTTVATGTTTASTGASTGTTTTTPVATTPVATTGTSATTGTATTTTGTSTTTTTSTTTGTTNPSVADIVTAILKNATPAGNASATTTTSSTTTTPAVATVTSSPVTAALTTSPSNVSAPTPISSTPTTTTTTPVAATTTPAATTPVATAAAATTTVKPKVVAKKASKNFFQKLFG